MRTETFEVNQSCKRRNISNKFPGFFWNFQKIVNIFQKCSTALQVIPDDFHFLD